MKSLIHKVLESPEFVEKPPVLIDVGASGAIHSYWQTIARHSICLAFDADDRELRVDEKGSSAFKKLLVFNSLVHPEVEGELDFYLTKSPFCSGALPPDNKSLNDWAFGDKFDIVKTVKLKSITLNSALNRANIEYVDWFKTDSQGLDLNLYLSMAENIRRNILLAEFEPGIIDAYQGEDKMFVTMQYMAAQPYWLAELKIKGSQKISRDELELIANTPLRRKLLSYSHKTSPGWGEMLYIQNISAMEDRRSLLLGWVFAAVTGQYGFGIEIAKKGCILSNNLLFPELLQASREAVTKLSFRRLLPVIIQKIQSLIK